MTVEQKARIFLPLPITIAIPAIRDRQAGEITPVRAEQSASMDNDDENYGAGRAIDLDLHTHSTSAAGSDGALWLKVVLDQVHCVQKVLWYYGNTQLGLTWTCNINNCASCVGDECNDFTLTVSREGATPDLSPVSDCKYGDTVKLERISGGGMFSVHEIVTIGQQGNAFISGDTLGKFNFMILSTNLGH